mgnify:CR=1 FL=1
MPTFFDLMKSIDWQWWVTDTRPVRVDWWPSAEHYWYVHVCRLQIVLAAALVFMLAAIFFAYAHTKFQTLRR